MCKGRLLAWEIILIFFGISCNNKFELLQTEDTVKIWIGTEGWNPGVKVWGVCGRREKRESTGGWKRKCWFLRDVIKF